MVQITYMWKWKNLGGKAGDREQGFVYYVWGCWTKAFMHAYGMQFDFELPAVGLWLSKFICTI